MLGSELTPDGLFFEPKLRLDVESGKQAYG